MIYSDYNRRRGGSGKKSTCSAAAANFYNFAGRGFFTAEAGREGHRQMATPSKQQKASQIKLAIIQWIEGGFFLGLIRC